MRQWSAFIRRAARLQHAASHHTCKGEHQKYSPNRTLTDTQCDLFLHRLLGCAAPLTRNGPLRTAVLAVTEHANDIVGHGLDVGAGGVR